MNILIVEDDQSQADEIIEITKKSLGVNIQITGPFSDFKSVLPHIKAGQFDMALVDIQLHDDRYAGINIAETAQTFNPIPILFISGLTDRSIIERTTQIKYCDFLQKPFDHNSLERAVQRATNKFRTENGLRVAFKPRNRDKYWIKSDRTIYNAIDPQNIICVEALDHHCRFYVKGMAPLVTKAQLKSDVYENGLSGFTNFFQLNRSIILNLDHVDKIIGNELVIKDFKMMNNKPLITSKQNKKALFKALGIPIRG